MSKQNKVLIGIIILLIGAIAMLKSIFGNTYIMTFVVFFVGGFSFLTLYRNKRKNWALILGSYLTYISFMTVTIAGRNFARELFPAMFFFVTGFIALVLYIDKCKRGLLIPGIFLLSTGVFLIFNRFGVFPNNMFWWVVGFAFLICGKVWRLGQKTNTIGLLFIIVAVFQSFKGIPNVGGVLLVFFGIAIIIKSVSKK
ncbi:hypothetical protein AGMMS49975_25500 [Clostridia bacterium]|nr:hypothetical protein AGMMS49975_25500 [Clostridia bacterium]